MCAFERIAIGGIKPQNAFSNLASWEGVASSVPKEAPRAAQRTIIRYYSAAAAIIVLMVLAASVAVMLRTQLAFVPAEIVETEPEEVEIAPDRSLLDVLASSPVRNAKGDPVGNVSDLVLVSGKPAAIIVRYENPSNDLEREVAIQYPGPATIRVFDYQPTVVYTGTHRELNTRPSWPGIVGHSIEENKDAVASWGCTDIVNCATASRPWVPSDPAELLGSEIGLASEDTGQTPHLTTSLRSAIEDHARSARARIQADGTMLKGHKYPIHLWVESSEPGGASTLDHAISSLGTPVVFDTAIETTLEAQARLEGGKFEITELSRTEQPTFPTAQWSWSVVPLEAGKASLIVRLQHRVFVGTYSYLVNVKHFPHEIDVSVVFQERLLSWIEELRSFFTSLHGLLLAAGTLIALVWGWLRLLPPRRKPS